MGKKFYQIIVAIIVMMVVGVGLMMMFSGMKKEPEKMEVPIAKRYVSTQVIAYQDYLTSVHATGRVSSFSNINLSSEVQGQLQKGDVALQKGETFKQGQLIAQIVNEEVTYNLKAQKSRFLNVVSSTLADIKIDFPNASKEWTHFFEMIDVKSAIPELPEINSNQLKIFLASRNILADYYSIKSAEVRVAKHKIFAPFDGTFTKVNMQVGSIVNPGGIIASIINTNFYEIEIPVEKNEVVWLSINQPVTVISESKTFDTLNGSIARIANFLDPLTQTISVFVKVKAKPGVMYEGDYFTGIFENIQIKDVTEVPRSAIFNHDEIFTVEDGRLVKRKIQIQKINNGNAYIHGLKEGSVIVNEPLINANENTQVEILDKTETK